ncbi:hypothetical protein CC2G_010012 [Coprinopsis cinerea AmutBmut pab1-1]|nr:hypothetical protein CC2G_010012 [Coprinopsis cinerea AmutBmut pab1-1]
MATNENGAGSDTSQRAPNYYLLKAEPDSRIVKGQDVKFSVDDFEEVKTSPWEGVRNFEARNIMKEMKVGDKALFYHSNCKNPGIAAFAEVSREAYPDFTAWDESHPYFDPKTDKENPKWFMVDLTFVCRPKNFVPLALLRYIATLTLQNIPSELSYLGKDGIKALQGMDLVTRGRLSVQRVRQPEWEAIQKLAEHGGWDDLDLKKKQTGSATAARSRNAKGKQAARDEKDKDKDSEEDAKSDKASKKAGKGKAGKAKGTKRPATNEDSDSSLTDLDGETASPAGGARSKAVPEAESREGEGLRRSKRRKT